MMLNVYKNAVGLCSGEEGLVVFEGLDCGFGDQDMDFALDGVESNGVMCRIRCEDGDGISGGQSINGFLVGFSIAFVVGGVGGEGGI
jgi:hypothetical protein